MPAAIPILVNVGATAFGWSAVSTAIAVGVSSVAVGLYEQKRAKQHARDAYNKSLQDRIFPVRSGIAARNYICGTIRTSGALMLIEPIGSSKQALDVVVAIANQELSLNGWYINDDFIPAASFPGLKYGQLFNTPRTDEFTVTGTSTSVSLSDRPVTTTNPIRVTWRKAGVVGTATGVLGVGTTLAITGLPVGASNIVVTYSASQAISLSGQFSTGTETQAATSWDSIDYPNPLWTANHRLRGIANARCLFTWDENLYQTGAPAIGVVATARGTSSHPFYDPRDGSNPATTKNPAILAGWWMTLPRSLGGCGIPSSWIDWQSISVAANTCDESVVFKNPNGVGYFSGPRYECNCSLSTDDAPLVNLETILSAMAGRRAFTGGLYKIVAGAFRPATGTITDADIVGTETMGVNTSAGEDSPPNIVTATFVDATKNWIETPPTPVRNSAYVTADGHEEPLDLVLPACTSAPRANYLMGVALEGSRPSMTFSVSIGGIGEDLAIYDTRTFNVSNRPAYSGKTFELIQTTDNWDGTFDTVWSEIRPQTWALDPDTYTPVSPVTPGDTSYLWNPPTIAGFLVSAITPQLLPDGTSILRIALGWDALPAEGNTPAARIELRYRIVGADWIGAGTVPGDSVGTTITAALQDGEVYQFQARYVNGVGAASQWVDAYQQIAGTPLPAPLSLRLRASSVIFRVPQTGAGLPSSINLDAIRTAGLTNPATFTTNPPGITLGGSGDNRTLAFAALGVNDSVQVTCTITQASIDYVDVVTIQKVFDGADADSSPDTTPPPTPSGLAVQNFLVHLLVTWTAPVYTVGHGHAATRVYAAPVPSGGPQPTFASSVEVGSSEGTSYQFAAAPGTTWAVWIRFQSRDGYLSNIAGGTNGVQGTAAQIGTVNLGPLVVQAGNLAGAAVTSAKLATGAVDATKFATGIEPVTIITGALPTLFVTRTLFRTDDQKLYRWTGTAYTAAIPSADISGQLTDSQIAAIAAAKVTGTITGVQIADDAITAPKIAAGAVTASEIAANAVTAGAIAAGSITTPKLAVGAVTANELAANSVIAGKIQAGAITANEIAAGAITTSKLAITGRGAALNDDPAGTDATAWTIIGGSVTFNVPSSVAPGGTCIRLANTGYIRSRLFPLVTGKRYRAMCWARQFSGSGPFYFRVLQYDNSGVLQTYSLGFEGTTLSGTTVRQTALIDVAPTVTNCQIELIGSYLATGAVDVSDIRVEEVIPGELIVDGTITARKLLISSGGGALTPDPETRDFGAWNYQDARFSIAAVTDTPGISTVIRSTPSVASVDAHSTALQFNPAKTYRVRCRARGVGANGVFYLVVDIRDSANGIIPGSAPGGTGGSYWYYPVIGVSLPSTFTQYEGKFGAGTPHAFPTNARTMSCGALLNLGGSAGYHEITDLLIEECVDAGIVVDGAITAQHLAANSIAVGSAAIQNGAIVNAMIGNAAIDSAKILELSVSKISAGSLGADINVGAGRIVFDNGVVLRAQGTGFGTANQFIDWYGPRPASGNLALCGEVGAFFFLKVSPGAYFGGSLSAGVFKNAAQTTDSSASAIVDFGPFLTNGGPKQIVVSYSYHRQFNCNAGTGSVTGTGTAQILLEKSVGGGVYTLIDTLNVSATGGNVIVDGDPSVKDLVQFDMSGAHTITDNQGATNNMFIRVRLVSRSLPTMGGTSIINNSVTQFTGFVSTE